MILVCCVLLSLSAKAQQTFSPFPKAGDKYWQKQVLVAMRNDYIRSIRRSLGMPSLLKLLPSS